VISSAFPSSYVSRSAVKPIMVPPKPQKPDSAFKAPAFGHQRQFENNAQCARISFISVVAGLLLGPQLGYIIIKHGAPVLMPPQHIEQPSAHKHAESAEAHLDEREGSILQKMVEHNELERNFSWIHGVSDAVVGGGTFNFLNFISRLRAKKSQMRLRKNRVKNDV
jgi:hypothetical protein